MQITIDTNDLSELDRAMLAYLAEAGAPEQEDEEVAEEPEPEEAPKPAAKKAAAPAKKAAPKKEPEPDEEEDLVGGPTLSEAIAAATKLVSDGEAGRVKAALAEVGVKRVSELSAEDVPTFLVALDV